MLNPSKQQNTTILFLFWVIGQICTCSNNHKAQVQPLFFSYIIWNLCCLLYCLINTNNTTFFCNHHFSEKNTVFVCLFVVQSPLSLYRSYQYSVSRTLTKHNPVKIKCHLLEFSVLISSVYQGFLPFNLTDHGNFGRVQIPHLTTSNTETEIKTLISDKPWFTVKRIFSLSRIWYEHVYSKHMYNTRTTYQILTTEL